MAAPTAETAPSRYWDSIDGEFALDVTEITGALPDGLVGTLYRNGSGRWSVGSSQVESIFDADGMVSAFVIDGSGVRFRNRFVQTKHYLRATAAGRLVDRGTAHQRPGGVLGNALRPPANTANTSVMVNPGQLLALWEGGRPHALDLDTLDTIGRCSLDGALQGPLGAYSAHYTYDPAAGTKVNFGFDPYFPRLDLAWALRGTRGEARRRRPDTLSAGGAAAGDGGTQRNSSTVRRRTLSSRRVTAARCGWWKPNRSTTGTSPTPTTTAPMWWSSYRGSRRRPSPR